MESVIDKSEEDQTKLKRKYMTYADFGKYHIFRAARTSGDAPPYFENFDLKKEQEGSPKTPKWWFDRIQTTGNITILPPVSAASVELWCMARLLHIKEGPTSFEDLRTVNTTKCDSFRKAAVAQGLFESDTEFDNALKEASTHQFAWGLRKLRVIAYCSVRRLPRILSCCMHSSRTSRSVYLVGVWADS